MPRQQPAPGPHWFYGYARVSHANSTESGISIETQINQITKRYHYHREIGKLEGIEWAPSGWWGTKNEGEATTDGWYVDQSVSAFRTELGLRPAGKRLNALLRPGDHVCFASVDRAIRTIRDFSRTVHRWIERGINVHFVTPDVDPTSEYGLAFLQMSVIFAELESRLKSRRIRDCFAMMRAQGRPTGKYRQVGWKKAPVTGQWIPDDEERALVYEMKRLREEEHLSWEKIAGRIEQIIARREGRDPYPVVSFRKGQKRAWCKDRCRKAVAASELWPTEPLEPVEN